MKLEAIILKQAEKKLRPYRLLADNFKREHPEYKSYLPRIQECMDKTTYWHGTGRYHYKYQGESRYEEVNASGLLDVLDSIIKQGGLMPHLDPWIDSGGKTVSLGTVRMHSRLFSYIHKYERDTLLFELGSAQYWVRLYFVLLLLWTCTNLKSGRQVAKIFSRRDWYRNLQTWGSAIRTPYEGKVLTTWELITGHVLGSDIVSNYPLLIGINKDSLKVINTVVLTHAVEVRSLQPVSLNNITHLEVPFAKVKEMEDFLRVKGVSLTVLPMEFVDAYLSAVPLKTLAYKG